MTIDQLEARLEPIIAAATNWAWDHPAILVAAVLVIGLLSAIGKRMTEVQDRDVIAKAIRQGKSVR
jgi:hypothetical protein